MKIGDEEYKRRLAEYIKMNGPNPGNGMFGSWAWYISMEKEFQKILRDNKLLD